MGTYADLTRGDVLSIAKDWLKENSTSLSDAIATAAWNRFFYLAVKHICSTIKWPPIYATTTWPVTSPITREISLPARSLQVKSIQCNGQAIDPTTIPELEGDYSNLNNANWQFKNAVTYPSMANDGDASLHEVGYPIVKYYLRGLNLGLVPPPSVAYTVRIDMGVVPYNPATDAESLVYPQMFEEWLAFETYKYACISERRFRRFWDEVMQSLRNEARSLCVDFVNNIQGDLEKSKVHIPQYRAHFRVRGW